MAVEWSAGLLTFKGTTYDIAGGVTENKYLYWDPSYTTIFRSTNNLQDVFDVDGWLMCINEGGTANPVLGLPVLHAGIIQTSTITADKYAELRNTYVYNGDDSLDSGYPFEVPFKIVSEMTAIQSVKLSFRIMPYRAYSTAASSGGASTSGSGGDDITGVDGAESVTSDGYTGYPFSVLSDYVAPGDTDDIKEFSVNTSSDDGTGTHDHSITYNSHTHTHTNTHRHSTDISNHTHNVDISNHSHTQPTHTHTTPNHTHGVTYGLHEESNSPTIHYHINNGSGFGGASANFTGDQLDIDITASITGTGWKGIRFDTNLRCRIFAIIECKVDITA